MPFLLDINSYELSSKTVSLSHIVIKEGIAMLCGNEESVFKDFEEDRGESKFSKEKAVTLIIQLTEKRYLKLIIFYTQPEGW